MNIINLMAEAIEQGWSFDRIDKELYPLIKQAQKDQVVGFMLREELDDLCKQPEQEPVAYEDFKKWLVREMPPLTTIENPEWWARRIYERFIYTTPPQRTWVGLTDDEFDRCDAHDPWRSMRNVAAMLKEKNK